MKLRVALVLIMIVLAFGFALVGCSNPTSDDGSSSIAQVRFQNSTSDYQFYHGLKFGNAEFLFEGSDNFTPGEVTSYKKTEPGGYTAQGMDSEGNWQTIFPNTVTVEAGGKYTVVIEGSSGNYSGTLTTDVAPSASSLQRQTLGSDGRNTVEAR